jgi:hypothetical protein
MSVGPSQRAARRLGQQSQESVAAPGPSPPVQMGLARWLLHPVSAAFVVSRVVAVGALLLGGSVHQGQPSTGGLTAWDGGWYLLITRSGYGPPPVANQWSR